MGFEVDFIKALQSLSNPFFDYLNLGFTFLGEEAFFIVVAVLLYWLYDKRVGFRFANVYLLSAVAVEGIKLGFKRPRPYDAFSPEIRSIGSKTSGYSFPSGHSHSISNMAAQSALVVRRNVKTKRTRVICYAAFALATVLVMFSRMYLGQHYLSDVLTGALMGVAHVLILTALFKLLGDHEERFAYFAVPLSIVVIIAIGCTNAFDGSPLVSGVGAFGAFSLGYYIEKKWVRYDVAATRVWWKMLLRVVLGLGLALTIKETFKLFLPESIPLLHDAFRYFIMTVWVVLGAPLAFKYLKI